MKNVKTDLVSVANLLHNFIISHGNRSVIFVNPNDMFADLHICRPDKYPQTEWTVKPPEKIESDLINLEYFVWCMIEQQAKEEK